MPAPWDKAKYDANYRLRVEHYMPGGAPGPNDRPQVLLHYHKFWMQPLLANRWAVLQSVLNIQSSDFVCVVGAGFAWGVEAIIAESGATVIGIDLSDYIDTEQDKTEELELRAEVSLVGLDPDTGRGLEIMNFVFDGQPRSNVVVLKNDAASGPQRQAIRQALGGNWPSVVIAEDVITDDWTDSEIVSMRNSMNGFGGSQRLIFLYTQTQKRTFQSLFDLLPGTKEVISADGTVHLT